MSRRGSDREDALNRIRRTYRSYREAGRERIWDPANRGYARLVRDHDWALVDLVRRSLPVGGHVLDVGCGRGDLAELARAEMADVSWTGVDLLPESIAEARGLRPWATWIEASADRLPLPDDAFDVAVVSTLFSSLPTVDLERDVATEIARILRPAGWLVWYDLRYDNPRNPHVHGIEVDALASLFPGWRSELKSMTVLPPLARRLGRLTSAMYPMLEKLPPLRSHLVGRLQRPGSA